MKLLTPVVLCMAIFMSIMLLEEILESVKKGEDLKGVYVFIVSLLWAIFYILHTNM